VESSVFRVNMNLITTHIGKRNGKLGKKYIGKYPPPVEKTNKHESCRSDNESSPSIDTPMDASNNSERET
jgi:hypothetical protein